MPASFPKVVTTKRGLIVHDAVAFLVLLGTTAALFGLTLIIFNSFQAHRRVLASRWAARGQVALAAGQTEQAVFALRTALSYTPEGAEVNARQLMYAEALAKAGDTDEAMSYFQNWWEIHPGDGFVNLQLARLSRRMHDDGKAEEYYRASVSGSWEGEGLERRREVRLELIDFLLAQHRLREARNELFLVAGNAPDNPELQRMLAGKYEAAGDPENAAILYQMAAAHHGSLGPVRPSGRADEKERPDAR